jgi:G:T-mismatch repair DNA endonuclease (very short patch repair protein)
MEEMYAFLSEPEKRVWDWLIYNEIPFLPQEKMWGGTLEVGGAIIDFILTQVSIAIRVMGTYWHRGLIPQARDLLGKEKLIEAGYQVVDIWEENLTDDEIDYTMEKAIKGEEIPR